MAAWGPFSYPSASLKSPPPPSFSFTHLSDLLQSTLEPCTPLPCREPTVTPACPASLPARTPEPSPPSARLISPSDSSPTAAPASYRHQHPCRVPELPAVVRTRGSHRFRHRVQTRTPVRDGVGTSRAVAGYSPTQDTEAPSALTPDAVMMQSPTSAAIPEECQGVEPPSKQYHTWVRPRPPPPPSHVHPRPPRRAPPSKRAQTSGPGESSRSRPEPSPPPAAQSSSPQLSPASRIRRPMFSCDPIPRNVNCRAKDFHGESYYDIPTLATDPQFRDSMQLIQRYSLLLFMSPRQFSIPGWYLSFIIL